MKGFRLIQCIKCLAGVLLVMGAFARGQQAVVEREVHAVRFGSIDIVIDSGKTALAAYQIEITAPQGADMVGLEGGESVFSQAPYYDPQAFLGRRIVVAAFSTEDAAKLPTGATRVARLHLQITGDADPTPKLESKLVVATDANGKTIPATITLRGFEGGSR